MIRGVLTIYLRERLRTTVRSYFLSELMTIFQIMFEDLVTFAPKAERGDQGNIQKEG